jgi:hypothetical protein
MEIPPFEGLWQNRVNAPNLVSGLGDRRRGWSAVDLRARSTPTILALLSAMRRASFPDRQLAVPRSGRFDHENAAPGRPEIARFREIVAETTESLLADGPAPGLTCSRVSRGPKVYGGVARFDARKPDLLRAEQDRLCEDFSVKEAIPLLPYPQAACRNRGRYLRQDGGARLDHWLTASAMSLAEDLIACKSCGRSVPLNARRRHEARFFRGVPSSNFRSPRRA